MTFSLRSNHGEAVYPGYARVGVTDGVVSWPVCEDGWPGETMVDGYAIHRNEEPIEIRRVTIPVRITERVIPVLMDFINESKG